MVNQEKVDAIVNRFAEECEEAQLTMYEARMVAKGFSWLLDDIAHAQRSKAMFTRG